MNHWSHHIWANGWAWQPEIHRHGGQVMLQSIVVSPGPLNFHPSDDVMVDELERGQARDFPMGEIQLMNYLKF